MELIFIDNGLVSKGGHSYNLAKTLGESLSRRELRYRVFGMRALDPSIAAEIGTIPHFSRSLYECMDLTPLEQRLRRLAAILRLNPAGISPRSEQKTWKAINQAFEQDLGALPPDVWNSDNLIVVTAISQNQISGLVRFLCARPRDQRPCVVCQLMFPPTWVPWGQVSQYGEQFYRAAFAMAAPLFDRSLFFTTENDAMRALYSQDFGIHTKILPIPFGGPGVQGGEKDGKSRLGFFGDSRSDKGFHLLPRAIELCQRQGLDAEFVVQIQHGGWEQQTTHAERALRALKGVRLVEGILTSEEFDAWTGQIDVMLLPYDPVTFGLRGSGIFTESVAAGRPIIASKGTFAGNCVEKNEAEGEVFAPHTSEELAAAILRLMPRLPTCKARGAERAAAFARRHSADAYVDVLLAHTKIKPA
jgi:glycosyltransferase involved in cell wall biosynthesis